MGPLRSYIPGRLILLLIILTTGALVGAESLEKIDKEEAAPALFNIDLDSASVSFFTSGSWKGTVSSASALSLTDLGWQFASTDAPILFAQEIDLTLELTINERWFIETSFLDDYDLNTYRAGYRGKEGETVQYLGVGNKGLDFPTFHWLDLGGDAPNSFGIYGKFDMGTLNLHTLVRYDATVREERVFIGDRERTTTEKSIGDRLKGRAFVLPDKGLDSAPIVYIEDADGSYTGGDGRKYRLADSSEYAASATLGLVELDKTPSGRVLVTYSVSGNTTAWGISLGSYGTSTSPGPLFLGDAQDALAATGVDLASLPQPGGGASKPATVTIHGLPALAVWEPGCFSPFEVANRYAAPSNATSAVSASLVKTSTGSRIDSFELSLRSSSETNLEIKTGSSSSTLSSSSTTYELLPATSRNRRSTAERWPLAGQAPEIYLPGSRGTSADLSLRFYSYGLTSGYTIGTEIVPSSVRVTRDGILDDRASYNSTSGVVTLSSPASANELIRISYLKKSDERRFGSLAAGLGAIWEDGSPLTMSAAMGMRWNLSGDSFSEYGSNNPGNITASASAEWKGKELTAKLSTALSYDQNDTSGLYRVAGMEDEALTIEPSGLDYKPSEAPGSLTGSPNLTASNKGKLLYRDYTTSSYFGGTTLKDESYDASVRSGEEGPYPIADSSFPSGVLAAEYDLDETRMWGGFQVVLPDAASALERAEQILLPIRFTSAACSAGEDFQVWLEMGALADSEKDEYESTELVCSRLLYSSNAADTAAFTGTTVPTAWKLLTLSLSDAEREALADPRSMRIVVRFRGTPLAGASLSGRLLVGSPVVVGSLWRPVISASGAAPVSAPDPASGRGVAAVEQTDTAISTSFSGKLDRLHPDSEKQRILAVSWGSLNADDAPGIDCQLNPLPLSSYKALHLLVRGPTGTATGDTVRLVVGYAPGELDEAVLDVSIPAASFTAGTWSELAVEYALKKPRVLVDGSVVSAATITWEKKKLKRYGGDDPTYVALLLVPAATTAPGDGNLAIDELTLEESIAEYATAVSGSSTWKRGGPLMSLGGTPILSNLENEATFSSRLSGNPFDTTIADNTALAASGKEKLTLNILALRASGTVSATTGEAGSSWAGAHSLSLPLGPVTMAEDYDLSPGDLTSHHGLALTTRGPVAVSCSTKAEQEDGELKQAWKASIGGRLPFTQQDALAGSESRLGCTATWLSEDSEEAQRALSDPYFTAWMGSFGHLVPDVGTSAKKRQFGASGALNLGGNRAGASLETSMTSSFSRSAAEQLSSAKLGLTLPFIIGDYRYQLAFARTYTQTDESSAPSATEDADACLKAEHGALALWAILPFQGLFDQGLQSIIQESAEGSLDATFIDSVKGSIQLKPTAGPLALVIPTSIQAGLERDLEQDLNTLSDSLILTSGIKSSATNLFGSFGYHPLFSFYTTDEYSQSIEGKLVLREDTGATKGNTWQCSLTHGAAFYGRNESELSLSNALVVASSSASDGAELAWTRSARKSLLNWVYAQLIGLAGTRSPWLKALEETTPASLYRETVAVSYSRDEEDAITWSASAKHETIVRVPGRISLSTFVTTAFSSTETVTLTIALSAGITLNLSF